MGVFRNGGFLVYFVGVDWEERVCGSVREKGWVFSCFFWLLVDFRIKFKVTIFILELEELIECTLNILVICLLLRWGLYLSGFRIRGGVVIGFGFYVGVFVVG